MNNIIFRLLLIGILHMQQLSYATSTKNDLNNNFKQALKYIDTYYLYPTTYKSNYENAIEGMLDKLGTHCKYYNNEELVKLRGKNSGESIGLGINIVKKGNDIFIDSVQEKSPAFNANISDNSRIMQVDGHDLSGKSLLYVNNLLRLSKKDKINIKIIDAYDNEKSYLLTKKAVSPEVSFEVVDSNYLYIPISYFYANITYNLNAILKKYFNVINLRGLILDLRDNRGGLVKSGYNLIDNFITASRARYGGLVYQSYGRSPTSNSSYYLTKKTAWPKLPLVVLVDETTASTAEIVAAALQEHQRATIIGAKTYGKGLIQTLIPLSSGGAVKLTTAEYYLPSGKRLNGNGVIPNIIISKSQDAIKVALDDLLSKNKKLLFNGYFS